MAGMTRSVRIVLEIIPPIIGAAMSRITVPPAPLPQRIGTRPPIIAATVIIFGRTRSTAPCMIAACRSPSVGRPARALLLLGHGPNSAEDYATWMANLRPVADSVRAAAGFASVLIELVRDDAPAAVRAEAVKGPSAPFYEASPARPPKLSVRPDASAFSTVTSPD